MKSRTPFPSHVAASITLAFLFGCRSDEHPPPPPVESGFPTTTASPGTSTNPTTGATSTTSDSDTDTDTDTPLDCPGHRLYQCAGFRVGVYDDVTTPVEENDWRPSGAGIDPVMCFPGAGFVRQGSDNIGFGTHDHQQAPLLVCAPEIEGNPNDPTSALGMTLRDLCTEACKARPLDTVAIPENLEDFTEITGENWRLRFDVCDVGPGVDSIVDSDYGGNGVLCESIQGSPPSHPGAADIGPCTSADNFTDCPIDDLELCDSWRPDKWIFSTTDRVGNIQSVIHDDFLENEVNLSTLFGCDAHAYVYSGDGTGVATIDAPDSNDFLERLRLKKGYSDFSLRAETSAGWSNRYPLNTFQQLTDAAEDLPSTALSYELSYYDNSSNFLTRSIKIADCTAEGDSQACDSRDL